jgi:hypothetical protein
MTTTLRILGQQETKPKNLWCRRRSLDNNERHREVI